jgi:hypothetical protein
MTDAKDLVHDDPHTAAEAARRVSVAELEKPGIFLLK